MTIRELNEILAQKDTSKILAKFTAQGFSDMTKHQTLKNFSLVDIAKSEVYEKTEYFTNRKLGFTATLHGGIVNLSGYQVIWLQVDKIDLKTQTATPKKCYIYYKGV